MPKLVKILLLSASLTVSLAGLSNIRAQLVGDLNSDHVVDFKDLRAFAWQWLDPDCIPPACTADLDGVNSVNMSDFALLANNWQVVEPHIVISEFMASNASNLPLEEGELLDGNGESSDWIELYNPTDTAISLDGWYLTDNDANLTKWKFPDGLEVKPGEFLVVFASEKKHEDYPNNYPYLDAGGYYHTNFNLDKDPGEYLALVVPGGITVIHEYAPEYPDQLTDISYGLTQYATTLVPIGTTASYHVPISDDAAVGTDWTAVDFNDSQWDTGLTALGFATTVVESGQDIGNPSAAGSHSEDDGVYTVIGDGRDIWDTEDAFYYAYASLTGDGELTASVVSMTNTNQWVKVGVMIRETLDTGSKHAMQAITIGNGALFQWRLSTDSSSDAVWGGSISAPYWVRIVRQGDIFTGYHSPDGVNWTQQGSQTITMTDGVYIGLCVTSHSDGVLCTAVFDNVSGSTEIANDLRDKMLGINSSLWARIGFDLEAGQADIFDTLALRVKYEDGFVAYLNGEEVARRNAPDFVGWNSRADSNRPIGGSLLFESINLMSFVNVLQTGRNMLAIHALNDNEADDEFLILPELVAARNRAVPQYFITPTPETFNIPGAIGQVGEVWFSHKRGFYDTSFQLNLFTGTDGAEIHYTTDGSRPTITHGDFYSTPLAINQTTTIRAVAVKPGWLDSRVETHTYLFEASLPLKSLPVISIVGDEQESLYFPNGIMAYPMERGIAYERPVSVELIYPEDNSGFQVNCGIRVQGSDVRAVHIPTVMTGPAVVTNSVLSCIFEAATVITAGWNILCFLFLKFPVIAV